MIGEIVYQSIPITKLNPAPYNPRVALKAGDKEYEDIRRSIDEFGYVQPLVWNRHNGVLVGGHQRLTVLKDMGATMVSCSIVNIKDPLREKALNIALNRIAGRWDKVKLEALVGELHSANPDMLALTGFTVDDLRAEIGWEPPMLAGKAEPDDAPPLPRKPVTKTGQIWKLGEHRIICGDATLHDTWARLTRVNVDAVWTDPPYGVAYTGGTKEKLTIQNDALDDAKLQVLLRDSLKNAHTHTKRGGAWYVAAPGGPNFLTFATVLKELDVWRHTLVWAKDSLVLGRADYHYRHEPIFHGWRQGAPVFYGWKKDAPHYFTRDRSCDTILEFPRPKASADHPTMKPVALIAYCIQNSTRAGETVADPFIGSGSTLLACEQLGRRCLGIEIDPRYCDVVVRRWEEFTGKKGILQS